MDLNLHIIVEEMAPLCREGHLSTGPDILSCTYPLIYVNGMNLVAGPLYIANAADLPSTPPAGLPINIICLGVPNDVYLADPFNILLIDRGESLFSVLDTVMEIFGRYDRWRKSMERAIEEHLPLRTLGQLAAPLFGNPVSLWTPGFKNIFFIVGDIDEDDNILGTKMKDLKASLVKFRSDEYLPPDDLRVFATDPELAAIRESGVPTVYSGEGHDFPCRSLIYAIRLTKNIVAQLVIDEVNHVITPRDKSLAIILGIYVKLCISASNMGQSETTILDELLESMLENYPVEKEQVTDALASAGWKIDDKLVLYIGKPRGYWSRSGLQTVGILIAQPTAAICSAVFEDRIVLVANISRMIPGQSDDMGAIIFDLTNRIMEIGQSEPFEDFRRVPDFYEQACAALEFGRKIHPDEPVHLYADYYVSDMVSRCRGDRSKQSLIPEGLRKLVQYDKDNDSSLVKLLTLYLECNMNMTQTSVAAYLHRNTCMAKIRHILEISSFDLDNPDVVLGLRIALRILSS